MSLLRINDEAPDFTADSTHGLIQFHQWVGDNWAVLFSHPNWNALTRLKWRVQRDNGSIVRDGISIGEGHRSNMAGYLTAGAVSQDAFNVAMADLMSSLSAIPTGR